MALSKTGAYCWYNNNASHAETFGGLYYWYAINTGLLCPEGWRVPSDEEWKILEGTVDTQFDIGDPIWDTTTLLRGYDAGISMDLRHFRVESVWPRMVVSF